MQYTLTCGGATAIVDTLGGELISYKTPNGKEQVWCGDPSFWNGHAPALFPFVSALKNHTVNIAGKPYTMEAKHGFVRKSELVVTAQSETSITFAMAASDETRALYPSEFLFEITHTITADGLATAYKVTNKGTEDMYFCVGGHAGFSCPMNEGEQFSDYSLHFAAPVTEKHPLYTTPVTSLMRKDMRLALDWDGTTLPLNYDDFDVDAYIFDGLDAREVTLAHNETGEGIVFTWYGLENLAIWTPPSKKAPFLCLEPWQGLAAYEDETGNFEDKPGVIRLAANESYDAGYAAKIIPAK